MEIRGRGRCRGKGGACLKEAHLPGGALCDACRSAWSIACGAGLSGADCPHCGWPLLFVALGMDRICFHAECPPHQRHIQVLRAALVIVILALGAAIYFCP